MARAVDEIEKEIRQLADSDRKKLLLALIAQLDAPFDNGVKRAWIVESHRRLDEIEREAGQTAQGPQVIEDARNLVQSIRNQLPK